MKISELKDTLYEIVQGYFAGAEVAWSEQNAVKSQNPLIRLKMGSIKRPLHFINGVENNAPCGYISSTTMLTVDLFTHGEEIVDEEGFAIYVNTALDDMADFLNYLQSPYVDEMCENLNISIRPEGDIKDTSAVLDNGTYLLKTKLFRFIAKDNEMGVSHRSGGAAPYLSAGGDRYIIQNLGYSHIHLD